MTDESDGAGMDNMTILIVRLPSPEEGEPHVHHHRHHHHRRHRRRSHRHHSHHGDKEEGDDEDEDDDYSSDGERGAVKRAKTS